MLLQMYDFIVHTIGAQISLWWTRIRFLQTTVSVAKSTQPDMKCLA